MSGEANGDKQTDTELTRLSIITEKPYLKASIDLITDIVQASGIGAVEARKLDKVLNDIFENIVKYGFEGDRRRQVNVTLTKRLHSIVLAVEDKGLPFDYDKLEGGEEKRFESYISKHYADEVNFRNLGSGGNRTEIVKNLPASDIRDEMDISEHHAHLKSKTAPPKEKITLGMLESSKIHELVRLVYKCYGYTYANEFMYYPEQIEARLNSGVMLSAAAYNSRNEIIGHVGFIFRAPGARVAESGEAVVDPRYRGRGIFQKLKNYLIERVSPMNVVGIYGEAVTVHPYSQKGSIELGGRETGFLLGYSPGTITFRNISENERPKRQSIAMMFTPVSKGDRATTYIPQAYADIIGEIYERIGFNRKLVLEDEGSAIKSRQKGRTNVSIRHDHNQALIEIERVGKMTLKEISFQLKHLTLGRFDCIYVDLPLRQKGAGYVATKLRKLGFFFGCVIPDFRDGDVLRLQYLNNVEISKDDIKTASDFGERLLGAIFEDMESVSFRTNFTIEPE
jgi:anti-sigma regulatory factor (Ser/Thr protein kinase)/GNAT superfamily N-acetyltransferase